MDMVILREDKFHPWSDCATCKHFDALKGNCPAYLGGIPIEIIDNWTKHREVRSDQEEELIYEAAQWAIDAGLNTDKPVRIKK